MNSDAMRQEDGKILDGMHRVRDGWMIDEEGLMDLVTVGEGMIAVSGWMRRARSGLWRG
jgi:hypothetical protein